MQLQVEKWGDSLALRLPDALILQGRFKEGDVLDATLGADGSLLLMPVQPFDKNAFLDALDQLHQTLPRTAPVLDQLRQEQRY